ncbi:MAG: glycosyltransferase family 61 protein [Roseococcus sp.]
MAEQASPPGAQDDLDRAYAAYFRSKPRFPDTPSITVVENALVSPASFHVFRDRNPDRARLASLMAAFGPGFRFRSVFDAGVHTAEGRCVIPAIHFSNRRRAVPPPRRTPGPEAEPIAGTWIYAGALHQHPGHFVTESIGRLWGVPQAGPGVQGLIWHALDPPKADAPQGRAVPFRPGSVQADVLECLGIPLPRLIVQRPLRVERLLVPDQLMALDEGPLLAGHPAFRRFLHERLITGEAPEQGGYRLFVSRAGLGARQSSFILEDRMEEVLRAQGWRILRPETLPLREQLAAYAGASDLLFSEGSSLHFYALVARPGQRVVILRRRLEHKRHIAAQLRLMGLESVQEWLCVEAMVTPLRDPAAPPAEHGLTTRPLLDFEELRTRLAEAGMLRPDSPPFASREELTRELDRLGAEWRAQGYGLALQPVGQGDGPDEE